MDSLYHITTAGSSMPVRDNGGEITFTVKNATGEALQTRFEVRLDPGQKPGAGKAEWFEVDQPLRTVVTKGVEQVKVKLTAPPSVAGEFAFRLYAVVLPVRDERFTAGPSIGCVLKTQAVVTPQPKIPWWIFLAGALAVLLLGGGIYYFLSRPGGVPKVTGLKLDEARAVLKKKSLILGSVKYAASNEPDGTVLDQLPANGSPVPADKTVNVTVSGFVTVPSVIGMAPPAAKAALEAVGLAAANPGTTASPGQSGVRPGTVAIQNPGPGKHVVAGTRVMLQIYVSQ